MKLARLEWLGQIVWAEIDGETAYEIAAPTGERARIRMLGAVRDGRLLAPIERHNKVVGLLDNFDGQKGRRGPGLFLKPASAVVGHADAIRHPEDLEAINFEAELAVVIGSRAKRVSAADAAAHILGYTVVNDVTSFPVLMEDGVNSLSTRFKIYDDFLPIGPWIDTDFDPKGKRVRCYLNGSMKQDAELDHMAFGVEQTVSWISEVMTLEPGDVIMMGTPPGFVPMQRGDQVSCEVVGLGILENVVV